MKLLELFLVLAIALITTQAFGEKSVPGELIVTYKQDRIPMNSLRADIIDIIPQINAELIKVSPRVLDKRMADLANNPNVLSVSRNIMYEPTFIPNDQLWGNQWSLRNIGTPAAWDITQGGTAPIAILDSGVDLDHPDIAGKLVLGRNFVDPNDGLDDHCGHGTPVAGIAGAISNNLIGVAGIAMENPIMSLRITHVGCNGLAFPMIEAIIYAADNGARVANISYDIKDGKILTQAAKYMHDRNGWVVAAAGNGGQEWFGEDNPYIISVTATNVFNNKRFWSSWGNYVDFGAPGGSIRALRDGGGYGTFGGTSSAAPVVAGSLALLFSLDPTLTSTEAYDILKESALDRAGIGWDPFFGWGIIRIGDAVELVDKPTPKHFEINLSDEIGINGKADTVVSHEPTVDERLDDHEVRLDVIEDLLEI